MQPHTIPYSWKDLIPGDKAALYKRRNMGIFSYPCTSLVDKKVWEANKRKPEDLAFSISATQLTSLSGFGYDPPNSIIQKKQGTVKNDDGDGFYKERILHWGRETERYAILFWERTLGKSFSCSPLVWSDDSDCFQLHELSCPHHSAPPQGDSDYKNFGIISGTPDRVYEHYMAGYPPVVVEIKCPWGANEGVTGLADDKELMKIWTKYIFATIAASGKHVSCAPNSITSHYARGISEEDKKKLAVDYLKGLYQHYMQLQIYMGAIYSDIKEKKVWVDGEPADFQAEKPHGYLVYYFVDPITERQACVELLIEYVPIEEYGDTPYYHYLHLASAYFNRFSPENWIPPPRSRKAYVYTKNTKDHFDGEILYVTGRGDKERLVFDDINQANNNNNNNNDNNNRGNKRKPRYKHAYEEFIRTWEVDTEMARVEREEEAEKEGRLQTVVVSRTRNRSFCRPPSFTEWGSPGPYHHGKELIRGIRRIRWLVERARDTMETESSSQVPFYRLQKATILLK